MADYTCLAQGGSGDVVTLGTEVDGLIFDEAGDLVCSFCGVQVDHTHRIAPTMGFNKGHILYFCDVCYCTFAGNIAQYPEQISLRQVAEVVAGSSMLIIQELRRQRG